VFSKEPGNLRNLHSFKHSGLANAKTIHVRDTGLGIHISTNKESASPTQVKSARSTTIIRARSGGRRALGITASIARRGYRPDLRTAALARVSALIAAQKDPKPQLPKKVRGVKAKAIEA